MFQNRVDPHGEIIRTDARGTLMGNRGVIHDINQNIVRRFKHKSWIACALQFKERHRNVMSPNRWTELFFLDEATAFAAGHRPCRECRREDFNHFKSCWLSGNPQYGFDSRVSIREIDNIIHGQRIDKEYRKKVYEEKVADLPSGTFVINDKKAFLLFGDSLYQWSPFGYSEPKPVPEYVVFDVLTPRSIVNAFRAGYCPEFQLPLNAKEHI